jgi:hypothetical protein
MDEISVPLLLKAFLSLGCTLILLWVGGFLLRKFSVFRSRQKVTSLTRILETQTLDTQRKLMVFSSPFGQGLILLSPRGDQVVMFAQTPVLEDSLG